MGGLLLVKQQDVAEAIGHVFEQQGLSIAGAKNSTGR